MTNQIDNGGFTIEQIYSLVGRYDYTSSISIRKGSEEERMYGNCLVGVFEFPKKERDELELRIKNLGKGVYTNIRFRCFLPEMSNDKNVTLINKGIDSKSIVAIRWMPCTIENIYPSSQKRTVTPIIINSPISSGNDNVIWTYEFLKRLKQDGIGLCPEEENRYLACKTIIEPNALSIEERQIIYDQDGNMNIDIETECITLNLNMSSLKRRDRKEIMKIANLLTIRYNSRMSILNQELKETKYNFEILKSNYPELANYIITKVQDFHQKRYNNTGKYPLFLDLKGYIHILLRHTEEARFKNKFEYKTKFQYDEKDIEIVMSEVLSLVNKDYQEYKESNPVESFVKKDKDAYYFNGDYYAIIVNPDGSIASFYKRGTMNIKSVND